MRSGEPVRKNSICPGWSMLPAFEKYLEMGCEAFRPGYHHG